MNFHDVLPRSYDRNSDPRNVASDGALSIYIMPIMPHTNVNIIHKMKMKYNEYNVISYFDGASLIV